MKHAIVGLVTFLVIAAGATAIGFGTRYLGLWGNTVIERKVFEESYQRRSSYNERIAIYESQLIEVNTQLMRAGISSAQRNNLEAQAAALRVQIRAAKEMR